MSDVFNRTTGEFLQSVNTPAFDVADWIINPDLTAVTGNPVKFWIIDPVGSDTIRLANAAEQTVIDDTITATLLVRQRNNAKNEFDAQRVLKAFGPLLVAEFNTLRTLHGLPDRTEAQLRTAIRNAIDAAP